MTSHDSFLRELYYAQLGEASRALAKEVDRQIMEGISRIPIVISPKDWKPGDPIVLDRRIVMLRPL